MINAAESNTLLFLDTSIEILELRAITAVIEQGSFTAAAGLLGTDKASVSRIVSRLEYKLRSQLLQRSTRRLRITEVGREFYERASGILRALEEAEASVARAMSNPTGTLKITAGPEYGLLVVNKWIATYLERCPDVRVKAEFTSRLVDVIHEGFDVAIRIGRLPNSDLSVRKLGEIEYGLFASPAYLRTRKTPRRPEDLEQHELIVFTPRGQPGWRIVRGSEAREVRCPPRYIVNNSLCAVDMATRGIGVALLPLFMSAERVSQGALKRVLKGWGQTPAPVHAVFASSRYMTPKVRAFVDLAVAAFPKSMSSSSGLPCADK